MEQRIKNYIMGCTCFIFALHTKIFIVSIILFIYGAYLLLKDEEDNTDYEARLKETKPDSFFHCDTCGEKKVRMRGGGMICYKCDIEEDPITK